MIEKARILLESRSILEKFVPGLDGNLLQCDFPILETPDSPGASIYRNAGGAKVLIPELFKGKGAQPVDALHIQAAIASRSPSLAVAVAMHNFSVVTLVELVKTKMGLEGLFLEAIAINDLLLASGFAEGRPNQGIFSPTMQAVRQGNHYLISGSKKPCSLSNSMDFLTASVEVIHEDGPINQIAVALIPGKVSGLSRRKFWNSVILAGAESEEIILENVKIEKELIFPLLNHGHIESVQISGYIWFELLITSSYLGMAMSLAERVIDRKAGAISDRAKLCIDIKGAIAALEGIANRMTILSWTPDKLADILMVRYSVQQTIMDTASLAVELLGGIEFIRNREASYFLSASRALAFHPPSRTNAQINIVEFMQGSAFSIV